MASAKATVRSLLARANLDVRRLPNVPFGVRWSADIAHYLQDRALGVAFDVGAHRGETTLRLLEAFPGVQIHSFEPVPESFAVLKQATASTSARAINAAVSDSSGVLQIAHGEASYQSGVHASGERIDVRSLTVDEYADAEGIDRLGLLKIDTEGHEEAILRGARRRLQAGAIEFVVCECEFTPRPDEPHGRFSALHALLEPLGYRVVSFYSGGVDNLGWVWGDVLYKLTAGPRDRASIYLSPHVRR
ncbi:MAG TPA: FkbM family methyltransferase [Solirubrobacteraceae bacterium]|jgi:FkbM family methyltransferase|nr:FkbM family methyltransferase [Solirubrobacteraceae bacterium]